MGVHMDGETVNNLRFADDIDLIAESLQELQQITDKVNAGDNPLEINPPEKTHLLVLVK